jgi:flavin-dependent dehydrogenase
LVGARQVTPVKGYPMRFDFPTARVAYAGLVLVGETAGLVNPLTGEGIDTALESAETGATVLIEALRSNCTEHEIERRITRALRGQFLRPFLRISHFRDIYVHGWVLNRVARACLRSDEFRSLMVEVCLGNMDPGQSLAPKRLAQLALA